MKILFYISIVLISWGCEQNNTIVSPKITARFHVMDENFSPKWVLCDDIPKPFLVMNSHDCSFIIDNKEFDINEKWILDTLGTLKEYWLYKPMGPIIYERTDFDNDQLLSEYIGADNVKIQISTNHNYIIDSGDTLEIEQVFEKERLFFVKRTSQMIDKHIRLIYQYE